MEKIYVLLGARVEDDIVAGVFSSMKKANEAKAFIIKTDSFYKTRPNVLSIETYELNKEIYFGNKF